MIYFDRLENGRRAVFVEIVSRSALIVSWLLRPTNEDVAKAVVNVARSYAPGGPFVSVAEVPGNQNYYRDAGAHIADQWRVVYYKLRVTSPDGGVEESEAEGVASQPSLETIAVRRRADLSLKLEGVPCLVYLRKGAGEERCPACWDATLKKVQFSTCPRCFNTGRLGGYYSPFLTQVKINPNTKVNEPGDTLRQVVQTTAQMSYFPIVSPRDIIYEVNTGKRWRLIQVTPTEHHRVVVHQDLVVIQLNPTDIEHTLPIPTGLHSLIRPWRDERSWFPRPVLRDTETTPENEKQGRAEGTVDFIDVEA